MLIFSFQICARSWRRWKLDNFFLVGFNSLKLTFLIIILDNLVQI